MARPPKFGDQFWLVRTEPLIEWNGRARSATSNPARNSVAPTHLALVMAASRHGHDMSRSDSWSVPVYPVAGDPSTVGQAGEHGAPAAKVRLLWNDPAKRLVAPILIFEDLDLEVFLSVGHAQIAIEPQDADGDSLVGFDSTGRRLHIGSNAAPSTSGPKPKWARRYTQIEPTTDVDPDELHGRLRSFIERVGRERFQPVYGALGDQPLDVLIGIIADFHRR